MQRRSVVGIAAAIKQELQAELAHNQAAGLERCTSLENGLGNKDAVPENFAGTTSFVIIRNVVGWSIPSWLFSVGSVNDTSAKTVWSMLAASAGCQSVMSMGGLDWILAILHMSKIVPKYNTQSNFLLECNLGAKSVLH